METPKYSFIYKLCVVPGKVHDVPFIPTGIETASTLTELEKKMLKNVRDLIRMARKEFAKLPQN